jgi:hypothetical protein
MGNLSERLRETAKTCNKRNQFEAHVKQKLEQAADENERLVKRIAELERVLQIHGVHVTECAKWDKMDSGQLFLRHDWPCSCGLEAALQEDDK